LFCDELTGEFGNGLTKPSVEDLGLLVHLGELVAPYFWSFATWSNSGIEPDKDKGISSPGTYGASLMWPPNDGERQWNTMSDWTYR
jgi:hypothetical protein